MTGDIAFFSLPFVGRAGVGGARREPAFSAACLGRSVRFTTKDTKNTKIVVAC